MALFDRLLGTRKPSTDRPPASAGQLRADLLALNDPQKPWIIRDGAPEQVDLVAEWYAKPGPQSYHLQILVKLDETRHEALGLDRLWSSSRTGGGAEYNQGNINQRAVGWTLERDENGKRRLVKESELDSRDLKNPLRDTVTTSGWTWKGRIRKP